MNTLALTALLAAAAFGQQQIGSIKQESSGPCTTNVAGVQGNVTIYNCAGIDPKIVQDLNRQNRKQNGQIRNLNERITAEEKWFAQLEPLLIRLASPGLDAASSNQAEALIREGQLDQAEKVLRIRPFVFAEAIPNVVAVEITNFSNVDIVANFKRGDLEAHKQNGLLNIGGETPLSMYIQDGVFYVDALINDRAGREAVRLTKSTVEEVMPPGWDRNFSATALEVVDGRQRPVFQMIRKRSNLIQINGLFVSKSGAVVDVRAEKALFKYPGWKYPGVYADPEPAPQYEDLSGLSAEELRTRTLEYVGKLQGLYAAYDKDFWAIHADLGPAMQRATSQAERDNVNRIHMARHAAQDREYEAKFKLLLSEGRSLEAELIRRLSDKPGFMAPEEPFQLKTGTLAGPDSLTMLAQYFKGLADEL